MYRDVMFDDALCEGLIGRLLLFCRGTRYVAILLTYVGKWDGALALRAFIPLATALSDFDYEASF